MISAKFLLLGCLFAICFEILQEVVAEKNRKKIGKATEFSKPTDRFVHIIVFMIHTFVYYALAYFISTLL